jgi:hypothetical protein
MKYLLAIPFSINVIVLIMMFLYAFTGDISGAHN